LGIAFSFKRLVVRSIVARSFRLSELPNRGAAIHMRRRHGQASTGRGLGQFLLPHRTTAFPNFFFAQFQMTLRRPAKPIILARKAGADPVGASYPKVSCPP
jgi:hypothetical protein